MSEIRYEKILQRQGEREDLPVLDSGEFGFANDTGQLYIGTDPEKANYIKNNIVEIYPFPNAKQVVEGYLATTPNTESNGLDFSMYEVSEYLTIETELERTVLITQTYTGIDTDIQTYLDNTNPSSPNYNGHTEDYSQLTYNSTEQHIRVSEELADGLVDYINTQNDLNTSSPVSSPIAELQPRKSILIMDYINEVNDSTSIGFGGYAVPIASLQQNVEIITNQNIYEYAHPSDFHAHYNPISGYSRPSRSLLSKELDSTLGGVFLEYDIAQIFYLEIKYVVVQEDGWHRRSGVMRVISDNETSYSGNVGFVDNQTLFNAAIDNDFIEFDAEVINGKLRVTFNQPTAHASKIFYRIDRWNIDGIVDGAFNSMPQPDPDTILGSGGGALGGNGNYIQIND